MILPFSTQFKDGTPNYFIYKIWMSLRNIPHFDKLYSEYVNAYKDKFKTVWDIEVYKTTSAKLHTIREDIHDRWHEGSLIHPVVFNRSKNQFQFAPTMACKAVQKIAISSYADIVRVDGHDLTWEEMERLAKNDGFINLDQFFEWFYPTHQGKIIHWTNLKY